MSAWLLDNEKYALIALEVRVDQRIPLQEFAPGYWAWTDVSLEVPAHWRDASVQVDEVEQAALFGRVQEQLIVSPPPGGAWRLFRALTVYVEARQTREVLDRLINFAVALTDSFFQSRGRVLRSSRAGRCCSSVPDTMNLWVSFTGFGAISSTCTSIDISRSSIALRGSTLRKRRRSPSI